MKPKEPFTSCFSLFYNMTFLWAAIFLSPCLKGNFRQVFFPKPTNNIAPKYNATNGVYIHLTTICL